MWGALAKWTRQKKKRPFARLITANGTFITFVFWGNRPILHHDLTNVVTSIIKRLVVVGIVRLKVKKVRSGISARFPACQQRCVRLSQLPSLANTPSSPRILHVLQEKNLRGMNYVLLFDQRCLTISLEELRRSAEPFPSFLSEFTN